MQEFTDGCAAQYKSRNCIISCSLAHFGFLVQRSFFETSHAKGEQDAARANMKQKVSQALLGKTAFIRSCKDMTEFLNSTFTSPTATTFASRQKAVGIFLCANRRC